MSISTAVGLMILALALTAVGGAVTGTRIGAQYLGRELAAMMGALFGISVVPAMIVGLLLLGMLK
jgi:hypothetical protein